MKQLIHIFIIITVLLCSAGRALAQELPCGTSVLQAQERLLHPSMPSFSCGVIIDAAPAFDPVVIPVVIHYLSIQSLTTAERAAFTQAAIAQIESLNADFGGYSPRILDITANNHTWGISGNSTIGGDSKISFCLTKNSVNQTNSSFIINSTFADGIDFVQVSQNPNGSPNLSQIDINSAHISLPQWAGVLNIYVADKIWAPGEYVGGFGCIPYEPTTNSSNNLCVFLKTARFGKGKIGLTHEVGHWLGLEHIWGRGDALQSNDCTDDDCVNDTPLQQCSNQGLALQPPSLPTHFSEPSVTTGTPIISCDPNNTTGDMYFNFMDYSRNADVFSVAQIWRMQYMYDAYKTARPLNAKNTNCIPPPIVSCQTDICQPSNVVITIAPPLGYAMNDFQSIKFFQNTTQIFPTLTANNTFTVYVDKTIDYMVRFELTSGTNTITTEKIVRIYCGQPFNPQNTNQSVNATIQNGVSAVGAVQTGQNTFEWNYAYPASVTGNVIVPNGVTLTVHDKVLMPSGSRIIVQPGGALVLSTGAILTVCSGNGTWQGVEVRSRPALYQITNFTPLRGSVVMTNNARIENAEIGILSGTRGDIATIGNNRTGGASLKIDGAGSAVGKPTFYNNKIGVFFDKNSIDQIDERCANNQCLASINLANFTVDDSYRFLPKPFRTLFTGVKISNDRGITITSTTFENKKVTGYSGIGILSNFGNFSCTNNTSFDRLDYGIQATRGVQATDFTSSEIATGTAGITTHVPDENVLIQQCKFGCRACIYAAGFTTNYGKYNQRASKGLRIIQNTITPNGNSNNYGIYLNACTQFVVQNNVVQNAYAGIIVRNSGANNNQIYRNYFYKNAHVSFGVVAEGINSNFVTTTPLIFGQNGLQIHCNDMACDIADIWLHGTPTEICSVRRNQGDAQPQALPTDHGLNLAGNTFNTVGTQIELLEDYIQDRITYNYHINA